MQGQRIGYIRVSTFDQNPERQLEQVPLDNQFIDKASGKNTKRPELDRLLKFVRESDTVVVHSMDRLAPNLDDDVLMHLSPLRWEHINRTRDYHWRQSKRVEQGDFRSLRTKRNP